MDKDNQQNSSWFMQRSKVSPLSNLQEEKSRNERDRSRQAGQMSKKELGVVMCKGLLDAKYLLKAWL